MVGEAREGSLHGPVLLWRAAPHLEEKHFGKQDQHHPEKGEEEFPDRVEDEEDNPAGDVDQGDGKGDDSDGQGEQKPGENERIVYEVMEEKEGDSDGKVIFAGHLEEGRPEEGEGDGRVLFAGHFEEGRPQGWLWAASPSSNADHGLLQFRKEVQN